MGKTNTATEDSRVERASAELDTAVQLVPIQSRPELREVLTENEEASERAAVVKIRKARRQENLRSELAEIRAEGRSRRAEARRARIMRSMAMVATDEYRRVQTYRRAIWTSRLSITLVCIALAWSAVNVQHNIAPNSNWTDPLWWLSYGAEVVISGFVVSLMLVSTTATTWGKDIPRKNIILFELGLMAVTVGLNAGTYLAHGELRIAAQNCAAPLMVGTGMWLHGWISHRYAEIIAYAEQKTGAATFDDDDLDLHALAVRIVDDGDQSVASRGPQYRAQLIGTVEGILADYLDGADSADIASSRNLRENAVVAVIERARQLIEEGYGMRVAVAA